MRLIICFFLLFLTLTWSNVALAQTQTNTPATTQANPRILGEVKEINKQQNYLTIKTPNGEFRVNVASNVVCKRVAPDAKTLDGAEEITFTDIMAGDRVWARNTTAETTPNSVQAKQLVLMSATSIAERNRQERDSWQRRGVVGEITEINSTTKEATVKLRNGSTMVVTVTPQADVRRYPPGSVEFTDSKPISFEEIKIGDTIFGRGERSEDGKNFRAEMLITGDVPRPTFGQIVSINLEKQEIIVRGQGQETLIQVTAQTLLRNMPENLGGPAATDPNRPPRTNNPDQTNQTNQANQTNQTNQVNQTNQANQANQANATGQSPNPARREGFQGGRGGMFNPNEMIERLRNAPAIQLTDLKAGEFIVVNGPKLEDGKSIKALFLVKLRIPTNNQNTPAISPNGGGFGEIGPQ
ncbi:MAG: hypothetical protein JNM06_16500 [Blastocatellia bacterium]|nr:hypothetical protein [Blastocatellia bacterium]